jgi:hypothetical protein
MPITPFLNGQKFDAETRRVLGVAFELVCVALRTGDCDDDSRSPAGIGSRPRSPPGHPHRHALR